MKNMYTRGIITLLIAGLTFGACAETTEAAIHSSASHEEQTQSERSHATTATENTAHENIEVLCHFASERALSISREDEIEFSKVAVDTLDQSATTEMWFAKGIDHNLSIPSPIEIVRRAEEAWMINENEKILSIVKLE